MCEIKEGLVKMHKRGSICRRCGRPVETVTPYRWSDHRGYHEDEDICEFCRQELFAGAGWDVTATGGAKGVEVI